MKSGISALWFVLVFFCNLSWVDLAVGQAPLQVKDALAVIQNKQISSKYRREEIQKIRGVGSEAREAIPALIQILLDPGEPFDIRQSAILACGDLGWETAEQAEKVSRFLDKTTEEFDLRQTVLTVLGSDDRFIMAWAPAVLDRLKDIREDLRLRRQASFLIRSVSIPTNLSLPVYLGILKSPSEDPGLRDQALSFVESLGSSSTEAVSTLLFLAADVQESLELRLKALDIVGLQKNPTEEHLMSVLDLVLDSDQDSSILDKARNVLNTFRPFPSRFHSHLWTLTFQGTSPASIESRLIELLNSKVPPSEDQRNILWEKLSLKQLGEKGVDFAVRQLTTLPVPENWKEWEPLPQVLGNYPHAAVAFLSVLPQATPSDSQTAWNRIQFWEGFLEKHGKNETASALIWKGLQGWVEMAQRDKEGGSTRSELLDRLKEVQSFQARIASYHPPAELNQVLASWVNQLQINMEAKWLEKWVDWWKSHRLWSRPSFWIGLVIFLWLAGSQLTFAFLNRFRPHQLTSWVEGATQKGWPLVGTPAHLLGLTPWRFKASLYSAWWDKHRKDLFSPLDSVGEYIRLPVKPTDREEMDQFDFSQWWSWLHEHFSERRISWVLGETGSGKSRLLQHLISGMFHLGESAADGASDKRIPLFVSASDAERLREEDSVSFMIHLARKNLPDSIAPDYLAHWIRQGYLVLIAEDLEQWESGLRSLLISCLESIPKGLLIGTYRVGHIADAGAFVRILPLSGRRATQFAEDYFSTTKPSERFAEAEWVEAMQEYSSLTFGRPLPVAWIRWYVDYLILQKGSSVTPRKARHLGEVIENWVRLKCFIYPHKSWTPERVLDGLRRLAWSCHDEQFRPQSFSLWELAQLWPTERDWASRIEYFETKLNLLESLPDETRREVRWRFQPRFIAAFLAAREVVRKNGDEESNWTQFLEGASEFFKGDEGRDLAIALLSWCSIGELEGKPLSTPEAVIERLVEMVGLEEDGKEEARNPFRAQFLFHQLQLPDVDDRPAIIEELARIAPFHDGLTAKLLALFRDPEVDLDIRQATLEVLIQTPGALNLVTHSLREVLKDKQEPVFFRVKAIQAVTSAEVWDQALVQVLMDRLKDGTEQTIFRITIVKELSRSDGLWPLLEPKFKEIMENESAGSALKTALANLFRQRSKPDGSSPEILS